VIVSRIYIRGYRVPIWDTPAIVTEAFGVLSQYLEASTEIFMRNRLKSLPLQSFKIHHI
jgi:hypothetical protein